MRPIVKYAFNTRYSCPEYIDKTNINDENEHKFIDWTEILQDNIILLQQSIDYFDAFTSQAVSKEHVFSKYHSFLITFMQNLHITIVIVLGNLYSTNNALCLRAYNNFCNNKHFLNGDFSILHTTNEHKIAKMEKLYKEKIMNIRNKFFGHLDELIFDTDAIEKLLNNVNIQLLRQFVKVSKEIVNDIWLHYCNENICFRLNNHEDYHEILKHMIKTSKKHRCF